MIPPVQYIPQAHARGLPYALTVKGGRNADCTLASQRNDDRHDVSVRFWRAILVQAIQDAKNRWGTKEDHRARREALAWLSDNKDFYMVCELADLHPPTTLKAILSALKSGIQTRAPYGEGWRSKRRKMMEAAY